MFGNIVASYEDLSGQEKIRYQELYCGLCHTIKERYGQLPRTALSFDLTFFVLLLNSLYEPTEKQNQSHCLLSKGEAKGYAQSIYSDYAADLTILFAYHKCLDDWHDEKKLASRSYGFALKKYYKAACKNRPEQSKAIEEALLDINKIEGANEASLDAAAHRFGKLIGDLFAFKSDYWSGLLQRFGMQLGSFIYMMDAAIDYDEDIKSGSYNPFVVHNVMPENIKMMLTVLIGNATKAFEKLPLEQDIHLIRSILYAGVWQQYYHVHEKTHKADNLDRHDGLNINKKSKAGTFDLAVQHELYQPSNSSGAEHEKRFDD